jgi:hypothetical protein
VHTVAFNRIGDRLVTASEDATARVWDAGTGREIAVLRGHEKRVKCAAFSPAGDRVVTASDDGTARVWDAADGRELMALRGHAREVTCAAYSPSGEVIATCSFDQTVILWDAPTGKRLRTLRGHEGWIQWVAFSPAGDRIVSAANDNTARLWDASSGRELLALRGHAGILEHAEFSASGDRIVTASSDGTARVWNSVPYRERFSGVVLARAAERDMRLKIEAHLATDPDPARAAEWLAADGTIDGVSRRAGMALVTRESERIARRDQDSQNDCTAAWTIVKSPASSREEVAEALAKARRALSMFPQNPGFMGTVGMALYRSGEYEQAIAMLASSGAGYAERKFKPQVPELAFTAMAEFRLGRVKQAREGLARVRQVLAESPRANDPEWKKFVAEAGALIEGK